MNQIALENLHLLKNIHTSSIYLKVEGDEHRIIISEKYEMKKEDIIKLRDAFYLSFHQIFTMSHNTSPYIRPIKYYLKILNESLNNIYELEWIQSDEESLEHKHLLMNTLDDIDQKVDSIQNKYSNCWLVFDEYLYDIYKTMNIFRFRPL